jgi:hypothetical protein
LEKRIGIDFFPVQGAKNGIRKKIMPGSRENPLSLWKILENVAPDGVEKLEPEGHKTAFCLAPCLKKVLKDTAYST